MKSVFRAYSRILKKRIRELVDSVDFGNKKVEIGDTELASLAQKIFRTVQLTLSNIRCDCPDDLEVPLDKVKRGRIFWFRAKQVLDTDGSGLPECAL